jgi:hypothetical protein
MMPRVAFKLASAPWSGSGTTAHLHRCSLPSELVGTLSPAWQAFVKPDGARDLAAGDDPGVGLLSRREIAKLQLLARRFEHDEDYQLTAYTRGFDEWIKNRPKTGSSSRIPLDDFLEATGMLSKKSALLAIEQAERAAEWAFGSGGTAVAVNSPR